MTDYTQDFSDTRTEPRICAICKDRPGIVWRDGILHCQPCDRLRWLEDNIQAPITTDADLISRAEQERALTPHEAYALRQRNRRKH